MFRVRSVRMERKKRNTCFSSHTRHFGTAPLTGEMMGESLKKGESIGMMCICKRTQQSRWTRRSNFARNRRVLQEAKWERATLGFIRLSRNAIAATRVKRPLALDKAQ